MKRKRFIYWFLITILLSVNAFILIHRNGGYKYFPYKTYSQLYVTDSTLYLKDVFFDADTLQLFFSLNLPSSSYKLIIDDSITGKSIVSANNFLHIPLMDNIHEYKLIPANDKQPAITVQADDDKASSAEGINELIFCNLPGPQIKVSPYRIWTKGIESFTGEEVKDGKKFLRENTQAFSATTDSARLMEVCKLIAALRPNTNGMKASEASTLSPFAQLQLATQNKVNLNCGNYSAMLYFFCSVLNLPNRLVTFSGPAGNWQYGVHYYNEIYLREKQQWVLCDGLSNICMPRDSIRFYNAADVYKMAHLNSFKNKYVFTLKKDSIESVPYDSVNYWHWYYNRNNANLRYWYPGTDMHDSRWGYLIDFYSFSRNFDFYSDVNSNDWMKIIIKITAFYLLLISMVFYVSWEIRNVFKKPGKMSI